jgi:hypothetical protein
MNALIAKLKAWWLPFWYGDPCKHGVYGHCYNDHSQVVECRDCMREIAQKVKTEVAAERAAELRAAFRGAFDALERRVSTLEACNDKQGIT